MNLKSIRIQDFQSHTDSHLNLVDGVNVITGGSDTGKSAVRRAIQWLATSKPKGDKFLHKHSVKPVARVTAILTDGTTVVRERRAKGFNGYRYTPNGGDEQVFEALGNTVPEEVLNSLGITPLCIQVQTEPYYMITNNSSQNAQIINELLDASEIDDIRKAIKQQLTKAKNQAEYVAEKLAESEEACQVYDALEPVYKQATERLRKSQQYTKEVAELTQQSGGLQDIISDITLLNYVEVSFGSINKAMTAIDDMNELVATTQIQLNALGEVINELEEAQREVSSVSLELSGCSEIEALIGELDKVEAQRNLARTHLTTMLREAETWKEQGMALRLAEDTFKKFKETLKICESCGTILDN